MVIKSVGTMLPADPPGGNGDEYIQIARRVRFGTHALDLNILRDTRALLVTHFVRSKLHEPIWFGSI